MAGLLEGKTLLVTGVLMDSSIAWHVAKIAQEQGATVILSSFGRQMRITQTVSRKLPVTPAIVELDVSSEDDLEALEGRLREHTDKIDGVLHSIGFAPQSALGGRFLKTKWEDVAVAVQISAFSLKSLAVAVNPLMSRGGSIVGLTFDATVAWPVYDWMGVAKAAFESTSRYLAKHIGDQGIRVNLVAAGPIRTTAAKSIPGFEDFEKTFQDRSPLGWDVRDPTPTAKACVSLLSDWWPATTASIFHVDGGFHAMGD